MHKGLTLNLGLRWDRDSLFQRDYNNVGPRAGFAWNIGSQGRTVVRGNTGIFYDTLESSAINRESNFGPAGQISIDLRAGDPLFPTFPNRYNELPPGASAVPRATVYVPIYTGDKFPYSIGDQFKREAPHFFNSSLGTSMPSFIRCQLAPPSSDLKQLHARFDGSGRRGGCNLVRSSAF